MPSSSIPAATAPDVTRITLSPCLVTDAISVDSFSICFSSSFPSVVVMPLVPTLTTINLEGMA